MEEREVEVWLAEAAMKSGKNTFDLRKAIKRQAKRVLLTALGNFTHSSKMPGGGNDIFGNYKKLTELDAKEIMEISPPNSLLNLFQIDLFGSQVAVPIGLMERVARHELYGDGQEMPFLVNLLNSGSWKEEKAELQKHLGKLEGLNHHQLHMQLKTIKGDKTIEKLHRSMLSKNLSIQVHLGKGSHKYLSKDQIWVILEAEKGAGIYLGLKEEVTKEQLQHDLSQGKDLSDYLNFVEVKAGEAYIVLSGTIHAVGAGILLLEAQENSDSPFRLYDWERQQAGQLHIEEALKAVNTIGARGSKLVDQLRCKPVYLLSSADTSVELIKSISDFSLMRVHLKRKGESYKSTTTGKGIKGAVVTDGGGKIIEGEVFPDQEIEGLSIQKGQSFLLPASMGSFSFTSTHPNTTLYILEPVKN